MYAMVRKHLTLSLRLFTDSTFIIVLWITLRV